MSRERPFGFAGRMAERFINSKLTPIMIIASILLGLFAVVQLPREEEPQIKVPMVDVMLGLPGASPTEVASRVMRPMEAVLWELPDVEYIYSSARSGRALITVRYEVGTDLEGAMVSLKRQLDAHRNRIPQECPPPLVRPRTIDDVPILSLTFHSEHYDHSKLRQLALQVEEHVKSVPRVAETMVIGGYPREVRIEIDNARLAAHNLTPLQLIPMIQQANREMDLGSRAFSGEEIVLKTGDFFKDASDVGNLVVSVLDNRPIHLREIATIIDGPAVPDQYVLHRQSLEEEPKAAVTLTVAKRPGSNAIDVVEKVLAKVETLQGSLIPADITVSVTRDYGHTAAEKSNELLWHMFLAVLGVALLILIFLGWRESLVVLVAIPSTLALTLLVFYLYGYTLNRITLFALIFSIGILVDDAIVVVENIVRHVRLPGAHQKPITQIALEAVDEVGNPTILATWAVIAAILPMAFVGGLMGPYMRPIPIGATAAMLFSLIIAFTITPWAAIRVLRRRFIRKNTESTETDSHGHGSVPDDWFTRLYFKVMQPMLDHARWRFAFLGGIIFLLLAAISLVGFGLVQIKMLPFDNKSEFQVILNMPEGTPLEDTARVAREMANKALEAAEVQDVQIYVGTAAPFNFNGLVRHYFARRGPNVADLQINLVPKGERRLQSHDIAVRIRPILTEIANREGANIAVAEVPPGPPVLQTIVMEVYAPDESNRLALATSIRDLMARTDGIVDLDWFVEEPQQKIRYRIDRDKTALHGIQPDTIVQTLRLAESGLRIDELRVAEAREPVGIVLQLPDSSKTDPSAILDLAVRSPHHSDSPLIPIRELVWMEESVAETTIHHKNLQPVIYVTADVAGAFESPAYALFALYRELRNLDPRKFGGTAEKLPIYHLNQPFDPMEPALKWDGEWHITLEVFRDLGIAFAVVVILIAMLMVGWFRSYMTPLVVMSAIPFSLIGILPAHWAMGAFFTATSMIGFMAGAGIVVRNSIILVDFIELRRADGLPLKEAVVEAGAIRFRPMLLTTLALVVGASVILADPIFQGLAISLMFGEIASLLISRMAVPVLYFMANRNKDGS